MQKDRVKQRETCCVFRDNSYGPSVCLSTPSHPTLPCELTQSRRRGNVLKTLRVIQTRRKQPHGPRSALEPLLAFHGILIRQKPQIIWKTWFGFLVISTKTWENINGVDSVSQKSGVRQSPAPSGHFYVNDDRD